MSTNTRTAPFVEAMTTAMSNREQWPLWVACQRVTGPFRGAPCVGHADCRAAYWQRTDAEAAAELDRVAAEADRERIELGGLRPKRRIRA